MIRNQLLRLNVFSSTIDFLIISGKHFIQEKIAVIGTHEKIYILNELETLNYMKNTIKQNYTQ